MENTEAELRKLPTRHIDLSQYHITEACGFAVEDPLTFLPEYFKPWADIAENLEILVYNKDVRNKVSNLSVLDHSKLRDRKEKILALNYLCHMTQAYIFQNGEDVPEVLPASLAIPYHAIAEELGVPPSHNLFTYGNANWKLKDPSGPPVLENLDTIVTTAAGKDEKWFSLVTLTVEFAAAPSIYAIAEAQLLLGNGRDDVSKLDEDLENCLRRVQDSLAEMKKQFLRMPEHCDPHVFYNVLRPFLQGYDSPSFKKKGLQGIIFEGVSQEPLSYIGTTAAQSSTLATLDVGLGITHGSSQEVLCKDFMTYMPKDHQRFIEDIANGPSIRDYVLQSKNKPLIAAYNTCLRRVKEFRSAHLNTVVRYIIIQEKKASGTSQDTELKDAVGTGGTSLMDFLKGLRDSTIEALLDGPTQESGTIFNMRWFQVTVAVGVISIATMFYFRISS